jgi:hypothetical protein
VQGQIPNTSSAAANTVAVQGINQSTGAGGIGVQGQTNIGTGVVGLHNATSGAGQGMYGQSSSPGGFGVIGVNTAAGGTALQGYISGPGTSAIAFSGTASPGNYAAYFTGSVYVNGPLTVTGTKSAAVPHPDGSLRLVYCEEAPESWFADYGTGQLVNGKATVALDKDFAAVVDTSSYHVFLAPQGESKGLYTINHTPTGFVVQEQGGGTSSLAFSYRVVAKRKDIKAGRLAKAEVPTAPKIDPASFPKAAPTPPAPPKPPKQP